MKDLHNPTKVNTCVSEILVSQGRCILRHTGYFHSMWEICGSEAPNIVSVCVYILYETNKQTKPFQQLEYKKIHGIKTLWKLYGNS